MGKRSNFERRDRDLYLTPLKPVLALRPHLPRGFTFCEPCAADGGLARHVEAAFGARCLAAYDIEPLSGSVDRLDSLGLTQEHIRSAQFIISNTPWQRDILHQMIRRFSALAPTWLLFDADWWHTVQSAPFRRLVRKVVSVGRVRWIEGSESTGKDNVCWYLFDPSSAAATRLYGLEDAA